MQPMTVTSRPNIRINKWNQFSWLDECLPNAFRKDLHRHFKDELRIQQKQQVKDKQPHTSVAVAYLTYPSDS